MRDRPGGWGRVAASAVLAFLVVAGCGGGSDKKAASSDSSSSKTSSTIRTAGSDSSSSSETSSDTLPPGATKGLDDYNGDGEPEPTCGTQDFGGGLVLRILCDIDGRNSSPPDGVTLTPDSLFRLPSDDTVDLNGISGSAVYARDDAGKKVYVIVFNSDGLFETGSAEISGVSTFENLVTLINKTYPGSRIQVRGHTDSVGTPASNQSLSEARASNGAEFLRSHGVNASEVTSIGFGQTQPLAVEDNDAAREFNRRVEVAIRLTT
jgi:outer membrane protein OmpA-like peptidoglycan-associated protein